jgi:putative membrane protein
MKNIALFTLLVAASCSFVACQSPESRSGADKDSASKPGLRKETAKPSDDTSSSEISMHTKVDDDEASFMKEAGLGGMMEVESGKVAEVNSQNAQVKAFAKQMVRDHSKANEELKKLAEKMGILLPDAYPSDIRVHLEKMKEMKGATFDQHYMEMMVQDHDKTVALFKSALSLKTKEISDFAKKTLPILEVHDQMAKQIKLK